MTDAEQQKHKAYHEAGHAVLVYKLHYPRTRPRPAFRRVTIADGNSACITNWDFTDITNRDLTELPFDDKEFEEVELAISAGEASEKLFLGEVGAEHSNDRQKLVELENHKRGCQKLPPLCNKEQENQQIDELMRGARAHLEQPKWKCLVEATVTKLLFHETLNFGQFVGVAIEVLGMKAVPDLIHYFKRQVDGASWTPEFDCEGESVGRVLAVFTYQNTNRNRTYPLDGQYQESC